VVAAVGCGGGKTLEAEFERQIPWIGSGVWRKADLHNHTSLEMSIPANDLAGEANRIDIVELIRIDARGARVLVSRPSSNGPTALSETFIVPPGGMVIRARGRREVAGGPALCFYTNPIRIKTRGAKD
jgi:hypothetical protein